MNRKTYSMNIGKYVNSLKPVICFMLSTLISGVLIELIPLGRKNWIDVSCLYNKCYPKYAIYNKAVREDNLEHVLDILNMLGFQRTDIDDDWDLLWAHDYPFLNMHLKDLKSHQIVNHWPGCGYITNKVDLSTTVLSFLPRAFRLPEQSKEFLHYAQNHPNTLFVEKHNEHRNIYIRAPQDINLTSKTTFVQEFMDKPLLVDGYKFDIGVYVVITSINPLRVYIYTGDILFRYCTIKYYPFDPTDVRKYIVGDDYLPTWEIPMLSKYYNRYYGNMLNAFESYIRDQSLDPTVIWPQVEDIIRRTILIKEPYISRLLTSYKTKNFFDLMRFDLVIDDQLRVYLMEANMSPNLSSAHFKPNSALYKQVLYSALKLVGVGSIKKRPYSLTSQGFISERSLATNLNECVKSECDQFCNKPQCSLCLPCVTGSDIKILEQANEEHLHRVNMKRIFPKPILNPGAFDLNDETQNLTLKNKWMVHWFYRKCFDDPSYCL